MRYTWETAAVVGGSKGREKRIYLEHILTQTMPEYSLFASLFGGKADGEREAYEIFLQNPNFPAGRYEDLREHNHNAPVLISNALSELERDKKHNETVLALTKGILPFKSTISDLYGEYTDDVLKIYGLYLKVKNGTDGVHGLKRKDGSSVALHIHEVSALVARSYLAKYGPLTSAAAVAHDLPEDFSGLFGLKNFDKLMDDYIPESWRPIVNKLTNNYRIVLEDAKKRLDDKERVINRKNLQKILDDTKRFGPLASYAEVINELIESYNVKDGVNGGFYDEVTSLCYNKKYIPELAIITADEKADADLPRNRIIRLGIKYRDLFSNANDLEPVRLLGKSTQIKNPLKRISMVNEGYAANAGSDDLDKDIEEIAEDTLVYAEYYVMRFLFKPQGSIKSFFLTMDLIRELLPVFLKNSSAYSALR